MLHGSPSPTSDQLFAFPFATRRTSSTPSWPSTSSSSSSCSPLRSPTSPSSTTIEVPTPPSVSLFDSEMDSIFHQTIDTSFLDSRPSSPSALSLPILAPVGNLDYPARHDPVHLSKECSPHLTLSLPIPPASTTTSRHNDAETKRQIDVLTTILTSPNLLPTALPSLQMPGRPRSRSPSSSSSALSTSPSRAKQEILGSTSNKSQKSWLDALREAEIKAKAKRQHGAVQTTGFARL
ncbi:hypothetical protein JCM11491_002772 [Sporobolomyces phaffii]